METVALRYRFNAASFLAMAAALGWTASIVVLCALALLSSRTTAMVVRHDPGPCPWTAQLPGELGPGECLKSIGGVPIDGVSLVREPAYLANGQELASWLQAQTALARALEGDQVLVERGDGDEIHPVSMPVRSLSLGDLGGTRLALLLGVLVTLAIGSFVYWKRPRDSAALSLFVMCQGLAACQLISATNAIRGLTWPGWAGLTLYYLNMVGALAVVAAVLYLAATFPAPRFPRRFTGYLAPGLLGLCLAAIGAELAGGFGVSMLLTVVLGLGALVLVLLLPWGKAAQIHRLQARWILWGMGFPILVWVITRMPVILKSGQAGDLNDTLLGLSALSFPAGIGVAVLRERLFHIEVVIRRTVLGAGVTLLVLFLYNVGVVWFAGSMTEATSSTSWFQGVFISAVVLTFMLIPAQTGLEMTLDRVFFRNRYNWRRVLSQLPDALALQNSPDEAANHVIQQISRSMEARRIVISLAPEGTAGRAWTLAEPGASPEEVEKLLPPAHPVFWADVRSVPDIAFVNPERGMAPTNLWLQETGLELLLPLSTPGALVGLMACALPRGSKVLTPDDIAVLRTVAASLAMALSRSLAWETIRRMNEELEVRVQQRTEELDKARLQLFQWEKMASIGVLAAGVAHELNTPLGVVVSTAEQLSRQLSKDESQVRSGKLARLCLEAAQRAATIVKDLRSYSRPESKDLEPVDVGEVVASTVRLMGSTLRSRNVEMRLEMEEVPTVEGYAALLNQILANLILNAVGALGQDGWVRIATQKVGQDRIRITVEDSGPGIPPEIRNRIFEPFFTTKAPGEGTGLGLSLCFTFVDAHGGRIWEDGEPGHGARFRVELPLRHGDRLGPGTGEVITGA